MTDVFISYSRLDKEFVGQLREALIAQAQNVWIDWESIPASQAWWNEIQKGIARANNFVVVMSPESMASPICQMEIEYARQLKKRIIPVLHADFEREEALVNITKRLAQKEESTTREIWGTRQPHDVFDANDGELKHINYFFFKADDDFSKRFNELFAIIRTDYAYKEQHTTLELRALEWDRRGRDSSFLLIENELLDAKAWLEGSAGKEPAPTDLHQSYIKASEQRTRQLRNIRRAAFVTTAATILAVVFAIGASVIGVKAVNEAQANLSTATIQQGIAQANAFEANTAVAQAQGTATQIPPTLTQAAVLRQEVQTKFDVARDFSGSMVQNYNDPISVIRDLSQLATQYPQEADLFGYRALMYVQNADLNKALIDYTTSIDLEPQSVTYNSRANIYFGQREYGLALEDYNRSLELDPNELSTYLGRGNVYFQQGEFELAFADYQKAIELRPNYYFGYVTRGTAYANHNQFELALADFKKAMEIEPNAAPIFTARGDVYAQRGDYQQALADYNKAVEIRPQNPFLYSTRGDLYSDMKDYASAIEDYTKAIALQPTYAPTYFLRGTAYSYTNQYDLAAADLSKAIELEPQNVAYYRTRAGIHALANETEAAVADMTKAIALAPQDGSNYFLRGNTYTLMGKHDSAIEDYSAAIQLDGQNATYYMKRGEEYFQTQNFERAKTDYSKVIELDPQAVEAYFRRGFIYFIQNNLAPAIEDFGRVIELDGQYENAYEALGYIYYQQQNFPLAIKNLNQSIALDPQNAHVYNQLAYAYFGQKDVGKAIEAVSQAILLDPNDVSFLITRCEIYLRGSELELGLADCRRAEEMGGIFTPEMRTLRAQAETQLMQTQTPSTPKVTATLKA